MNPQATLTSKVQQEIIDPVFQEKELQRTARTYGFKIDVEFTPLERTRFINNFTVDLIKKIELYLQSDEEAKQLLCQVTAFNAKETFTPIIKEKMYGICKLTSSTRNVPTYSLIDLAWSWFTK